jgi:Zn-finger nucleic acid-binding protein
MDLDFCRRCGGMWFDRWGYDALRISGDDKEFPVSVEVKPAGVFEAVAGDTSIARRCPACDAKMAPHAVEIKSTLVFDRCTVCMGIWADELALETTADQVDLPVVAASAGAGGAAISTYNSIDRLSESQSARAYVFAQLCAAVVRNPEL